MSKSPFEPCRLNERSARVLGLPLTALTPGAQWWLNDTDWLWFDPVSSVALWQAADGAQHGFHADSLDEALEYVECRRVG